MHFPPYILIEKGLASFVVADIIPFLWMKTLTLKELFLGGEA